MTEWLYEGDDREGFIVGSDGTRYPCRLERDQVQVRLPFAVDRDYLRELLEGDGWAVGDGGEKVDSQAWGPFPDVDGYYPFWIWQGREPGETILAFPPQEYRLDGGIVTPTEHVARHADTVAKAQGAKERRAPKGARQTHEKFPQRDDKSAPREESSPPSREPLIGSEALEQFARWIPYLKAAALSQTGMGKS